METKIVEWDQHDNQALVPRSPDGHKRLDMIFPEGNKKDNARSEIVDMQIGHPSACKLVVA